MTNTALNFILGVIASGALSAFIVFLANKKKTSAETQEIAADTYRKLNKDLLSQRQQQKDDFQKQISEERDNFKQEIELMKKRYETQISQIMTDNATHVEEKNKRIKDLEDRVDILEAELERYHQIENKLTEVVTNVVKTE